jgi:type VI secretion system protein ImpA
MLAATAAQGLGAAMPAAEGGDAAGAAVGTAAAASAAPPPAAGVIRTREDAIRDLQRVCDWIEQNEPGHPAPLLIQRARRLMAKSFMDIVKDILPEGVAQIQKLAGVADK